MEPITLGLFQSDLARILLQTGWVARIILLILLIFSVVSWAIIYRKYFSLKRAREQSEKFLEAFRASERLPEARPLLTAFPTSPLAPVYVAGMRELESQVGTGSKNPHGGTLKSLAAVSVALQSASSVETTRLEHRMSFLATCASVTPFIGLFGTVWGIIGAFQGLSQAGATTLSAVAPGIADALVATAAGLFAAIPAVIAYNHFLHQIRQFTARMDNFSQEFLARAEKLYT
jgi:biopolymer transport protein TolQ